MLCWVFFNYCSKFRHDTLPHAPNDLQTITRRETASQILVNNLKTMTMTMRMIIIAIIIKIITITTCQVGCYILLTLTHLVTTKTN